MTIDDSRQVSRILEENCRRGGYILPCVRTLAVEFPTMAWETLSLKLRTMAYYGGYSLLTIRHNFLAAREG